MMSQVALRPDTTDARQVLMNPGPVATDPRVRAALAGPDLCHRESEFFDLMTRVAAKLVATGDGDERHAAVVLTGSGTAGLEAALASVVPAHGSLLVLDNGHYGERLALIADALGIRTERLQSGCGTPLPLDVLAQSLAGPVRPTHVALVHHETSSGMLNPLADVAQMARAVGAEVIVDAISSFGAELLSLRDLDADWVVCSSNKCLEGTAGLSFVLGTRERFEQLRERRAPSYYLDLGRHYTAQYVTVAPAFTPAIPAYYALDTALDLMLEETVAGRHQRYGHLAELLREGLCDLGLTLVLAPEHRSVCLTVVSLPPRVAYGDLHDSLKARGFIVYAGQDAFERAHFRLSTMGQMTREDIERFLRELREVVKHLQEISDDA